MSYTWKGVEELGWAIVTAVGTSVATVLIAFDPSTLSDDQKIHATIIGLVGAAIRAAAGAVISFKPSN